jgi:hypothetical protein
MLSDKVLKSENMLSSNALFSDNLMLSSKRIKRTACYQIRDKEVKSITCYQLMILRYRNVIR